VSFPLQPFHQLHKTRCTLREIRWLLLLTSYCLCSPFPPFLPLNISLETNVSHFYNSQCSSIAFFGHCPHWLRLVVQVIPSNSHNVFLSHFPPMYVALHYHSVSPLLL
jgi:hypothetical protein